MKLLSQIRTGMSTTNNVTVEIAVHTVESAIAAEAGRADRVELFSDPCEGGVTPSVGLIGLVRENVTQDVHIMIRPRGGDFHYSDLEFDIMSRDIETAKRLGANGLVFGLVNLDGTVDVERTRQLVEASRPASVTFHRAFDVCRDLEKGLEDLISCGVDRVLTSGGEANATEGIKCIANLVRIARNRIIIMAGGGVNKASLRAIVEQTGVREVHAGLRSTIPSPVRFRNQKVLIGYRAPEEYERIVVNEEEVRAFVDEAGRL